MNVELAPNLEERLRHVAEQQSPTVQGLVERVLADYLDAAPDAAITWVQATQRKLSRVWEAEDFSDWNTPHAPFRLL